MRKIIRPAVSAALVGCVTAPLWVPSAPSIIRELNPPLQIQAHVQDFARDRKTGGMVPASFTMGMLTGGGPAPLVGGDISGTLSADSAANTTTLSNMVNVSSACTSLLAFGFLRDNDAPLRNVVSIQNGGSGGAAFTLTTQRRGIYSNNVAVVCGGYLLNPATGNQEQYMVCNNTDYARLLTIQILNRTVAFEAEWGAEYAYGSTALSQSATLARACALFEASCIFYNNSGLVLGGTSPFSSLQAPTNWGATGSNLAAAYYLTAAEGETFNVTRTRSINSWGGQSVIGMYPTA